MNLRPSIEFTSQFRRQTDGTRFIMLLGVVLIHCSLISYMPTEGLAIERDIITLFSQDLPSICVPWFFIISAYITQIRGKDYKYLIRRRMNNIVVPYVLWNLIAVGIRFLFKASSLGAYGSGAYQWESVSDVFMEIFIEPALIPLWFLRNLFLFTLLFPILVRLLKINIPVTLILLLFVNKLPFIEGIFYYSAGIALAMRVKPGEIPAKLSKFRLFFPIFTLLMILSVILRLNIIEIPILSDIVILGGAIGAWGLIHFKALKLRPIGQAGAIFFVYAFHGIISPYVTKGLVLLVPWENAWWVVAFFISFIIVTIISFGIYLLTKQFTPTILRILTGGRSTTKTIPEAL